ncbi:MAG: hypothetical protein ACYTGX_05745 [Planctomycetota bacterium]|jgi:hypothetical protein
MDTGPYDEFRAMVFVIYRHRLNLLTKWERRAPQFSALSPEQRQHPIRRKWMAPDEGESPPTAEQLRAMEQGPDAVLRVVLERVLREHADDLDFPRCPECSRILRTPVAQQCFQCGHDWHARD